MSTDTGTWQSCSYCGRPLVSGVAVGGGLFHPECVSGPGYPPRPGFVLPPIADHIAALIAERDALKEANEKFGRRQTWWTERMFELEQQRDALRAALHEIAEEFAGSECGVPITAQEAYAVELARRMGRMAAEARDAVMKEEKPSEEVACMETEKCK